MSWFDVLPWAGNALVITAWTLVSFGREVPGIVVALTGQSVWFVAAYHIGQPAIMFLMVTLSVLQVSGLLWRRHRRRPRALHGTRVRYGQSATD